MSCRRSRRIASSSARKAAFALSIDPRRASVSLGVSCFTVSSPFLTDSRSRLTASPVAVVMVSDRSSAMLASMVEWAEQIAFSAFCSEDSPHPASRRKTVSVRIATAPLRGVRPAPEASGLLTLVSHLNMGTSIVQSGVRSVPGRLRAGCGAPLPPCDGPATPAPPQCRVVPLLERRLRERGPGAEYEPSVVFVSLALVTRI